MPNEFIRIYLIEDDPTILRFVEQTLLVRPQWRLVGHSDSLAHARLLAPHSLADVFLVDLGLPDGRGEDILRSERSLIQTIGRAARNLSGTAILYADRITDSMRRAIDETERRRARQIAFNQVNGITPRGVVKRIKDLIDGVYSEKAGEEARKLELAREQMAEVAGMDEKALAREIKRLEKQMLDHARNLEFEQAARVRDQLARLKDKVLGAHGGDNVVPLRPAA